MLGVELGLGLGLEQGSVGGKLAGGLWILCEKKLDSPSHRLDCAQIGGYLSVAYAERFPQRVERLILASPVGSSLEAPMAPAATFSPRPAPRSKPKHKQA